MIHCVEIKAKQYCQPILQRTSPWYSSVYNEMLPCYTCIWVTALGCSNVMCSFHLPSFLVDFQGRPSCACVAVLLAFPRSSVQLLDWFVSLADRSSTNIQYISLLHGCHSSLYHLLVRAVSVSEEQEILETTKSPTFLTLFNSAISVALFNCGKLRCTFVSMITSHHCD
jgi:hypothetical protein